MPEYPLRPADSFGNVTQKEVVGVETVKSSWNRQYFTIDSADGYLALECFSAAAWLSIIEEANFTLQTNKTASVITTLKVGAAAVDIRQNEFLARFTLILKFTPFSINRSSKKMSLRMGLIISTI